MGNRQKEGTMGSPASQPAIHEKFARKVTIVILLVGLAPLVVVTGVTMDRYRDAYQAMAYSYLEANVQKHARLTDFFLEERLQDISYYAQASSCEQLKDTGYLQKHFEILQNESGNVLTDMGVVETHAQGRQIAYAGPFGLDRARYGTSDWFEQASRNDYFISDVFMGLRGFPHFIVAVRKACEDGHWIVRGTVDFTAFSNVVENLRGGETGRAFIVNSAGILQTGRPWSSEKTVPGETAFEAFESLKEWLQGETNISRHVFCPNRKTLVVMSRIKNGDWFLVYQQEKADIFKALMRTHRVVFGALLFGVIGIVVMALYLPTVMLLRMRKEYEEQDRS
jgi:two-component system NtrC family sensor kinase